MIVYKMRLTGDDTVYWLTEATALPIMRQWENGDRGVFKLSPYGLMCELFKIKEIRRVEEQEPYPPEFKEQLANEGAMALPSPNPNASWLSKLPTEMLYFDKDMRIIQAPLYEIKKMWKSNPERLPYFYQGECHFQRGDNGEKQFYVAKQEIKSLIKMKFDIAEPDYPPVVCAEWRYGIENRGLFS